MTLQVSNQTDQRPFLIQSSEDPAFVFDDLAGGDHLCPACNACVLVRGNYFQSLVAIRIRCFECGQISETPALPDGEVFPQQVISLGERGGYAVTTVQGRTSVAMTCDAELVLEQERTRPNRQPRPFDLEVGTIAQLEASYDQYTDAFEQQKASVLRAQAARHSGQWDHPLPWACHHLRRCFEAKLIDLDRSDDYRAICTVMLFQAIVSQWSHHPRFIVCARTLKAAGTFWHFAFQLAIAGYLFEHGNRVGIGVESGEEPSPDLYVRPTATTKLHIEVKVPKALRWPENNTVDPHEARKSVRRAFAGAYRQLNRTRPGVLVVGCCGGDASGREDFARGLKAVAESALRAKGRDNKSIAAISTLSLVYPRRHGKVISPLEMAVRLSKNPHFDGEDMIQG